jgi:hypothetical protein
MNTNTGKPIVDMLIVKFEKAEATKLKHERLGLFNEILAHLNAIPEKYFSSEDVINNFKKLTKERIENCNENIKLICLDQDYLSIVVNMEFKDPESDIADIKALHKLLKECPDLSYVLELCHLVLKETIMRLISENLLTEFRSIKFTDAQDLLKNLKNNSNNSIMKIVDTSKLTENFKLSNKENIKFYLDLTKINVLYSSIDSNLHTLLKNIIL